jgi:hypothetical protein
MRFRRIGGPNLQKGLSFFLRHEPKLCDAPAGLAQEKTKVMASRSKTMTDISFETEVSAYIYSPFYDSKI